MNGPYIVRDIDISDGRLVQVLLLDGFAVGVLTSDGTVSVGAEEIKFSSADIRTTTEGFGIPFRFHARDNRFIFTNLLEPHKKPQTLLYLPQPKELRRQLRDAIALWPYPTLSSRLDQINWTDQYPQLAAYQEDALRLIADALKRGESRVLMQLGSPDEASSILVTLADALLRQARAHRILYITVDRAAYNYALNAASSSISARDSRRLSELFEIQPLTMHGIAESARLVITHTRQIDNLIGANASSPVSFNERIPADSFDVAIVGDGPAAWLSKVRNTLDYFSSLTIGVTSAAVISDEIKSFYDSNLAWTYTPLEAIAEGRRLDFDIRRIEARGSDVLAALSKAIREDIFPSHPYEPKTVIIAKDMRHAKELLGKVKDAFPGRPDDFAEILTNRRINRQAVTDFRNLANTRLAIVPVKSITGLNIPVAECVVLACEMQDPHLIMQMINVAASPIDAVELRRVTAVRGKSHFVVVDATKNGSSTHPVIQAMRLAYSETPLLAPSLVQLRNGSTNPGILRDLASGLARASQILSAADLDHFGKIAETSLRDLLLDLVHAILDYEEVPQRTRTRTPAAARPLLRDDLHRWWLKMAEEYHL